MSLISSWTPSELDKHTQDHLSAYIVERGIAAAVRVTLNDEIAALKATIEEFKGECARLVDPEEDAHTLDTVMAKKYDEARWVAREAIANSFPMRPSNETIESEYAELVSDFRAERITT